MKITTTTTTTRTTKKDTNQYYYKKPCHINNAHNQASTSANDEVVQESELKNKHEQHNIDLEDSTSSCVSSLSSTDSVITDSVITDNAVTANAAGQALVKRNSINTRWNDMYEKLLYFKQKHGHVKVPQKCYQNQQLGAWVRNCRSRYREYKRTNGQKGDPGWMSRLESIGLVDNSISTGYSNWDDMLNQLLEFKQKHGHLKVSERCSNKSRKLGKWVRTWRSAYRQYKKTNGRKGDPEQMKRLETIGLVDDISTGDFKKQIDSNWDNMFNQLLEFKQKYGHLRVPQQWDENRKLGRWVAKWRSAYKRQYKHTNGQKGDSGERMARLESIGLVDDILFVRKEHHEDSNKKTNCVDDEVFAPIIVSSMSPTLSSTIQNVTEEVPSSTGIKENKNGDSGGSYTQAHLDFLGSELRGKGGLWA